MHDHTALSSFQHLVSSTGLRSPWRMKTCDAIQPKQHHTHFVGDPSRSGMHRHGKACVQHTWLSHLSLYELWVVGRYRERRDGVCAATRRHARSKRGHGHPWDCRQRDACAHDRKYSHIARCRTKCRNRNAQSCCRRAPPIRQSCANDTGNNAGQLFTFCHMHIVSFILALTTL